MVNSEDSNINPLILNEETRYNIKVKNFTLGDGKYRDLQDRHHQRMEKINQLAKSLNVEYNPKLENANDIIKRTELIQKYFDNKDQYDEIVNKMLSVCTPEELLNYIDQHIKKS